MQAGDTLLGPREVSDGYQKIAQYISGRMNSGDYICHDSMIMAIRNDGSIMLRGLTPVLMTQPKLLVPHGQIDPFESRLDHTGPNFMSKGGTIYPDGILSPADYNIFLIDSVYQTGRTARSAMDQLFADAAQGRIGRVELIVLLDRDAAELPIKANYSAYKRGDIPQNLRAKLKENGIGHVLMLEEYNN